MKVTSLDAKVRSKACVVTVVTCTEPVYMALV